MADVARLAANSVMRVEDGLDAERWASKMIATWRLDAHRGPAVDSVLFASFVVALEALGTADALAALRALSVIGDAAAGAAADRLAAAGVSEPAWGAELRPSRPVAAALLEEPTFDDGVTVIIEFAEPDGGLHTLSVSIDHNLRGLVRDIFLGDELAEVRAALDDRPDRDRVAIRELDLGEARARIEVALDELDHTYEPPVDPRVHSLRALVDARLGLLPDGFELPDWVVVSLEERDALLADFLTSPEGRGWRGDGDAEYVAQLAIDFGAYNHGGPLRWSPVVVERFMLDWLERRATKHPVFFERVPEVLETWVSYAGRRRDVPAESLRDAVAAVGEHRDEMVATVGNPDAWRPSKLFAVALEEAGVDMADHDAVGHFIRRYSEGLNR